MKLVLTLACAIGCTSPSQGISGDTSPDDPSGQPDETTQGKTDKPPKQITRGKGVVMDAPTIVHVYWGSYWATDAGTSDRAVLDGFNAMVGSSSWWNIMQEYPDHQNPAGTPVAGAPVLVTDDPPSKLYANDSALHQFLAAQLTSGAASYDPETLYVVFPAPGTVGIRGECGHHSYFSTMIDGAKHKVIYALVPYLTDSDSSCGVNIPVNGASLDEITVTLSHEDAEAVTDPYIDAWMTKDGVEIADQCNSGVAASWGGAQFAVQDLWSNAARGCVH